MNIVMIVPTGIGAEIGGHAGDANPTCKLLASVADNLLTHPNVVNASDINEMPDNVWYIEGSMLDRFLEGEFNLERPHQNRILVVVNAPIRTDTINAVSAARSTIGIDATILELETLLEMIASFHNGEATGQVRGWRQLVDQVRPMDFDALAIQTPIDVSRDVALAYYRKGGVNPWGGVEAKASRLIAATLRKPVAHAPLENTLPTDEELYRIMDTVVDPRMAPEVISLCYLHCVLKGLHRAPRVVRMNYAWSGLSVHDIDAMVAPADCFGPAHKACLSAGIPVIAVRENGTIYEKSNHPALIYVENYWEAAGVLLCMQAGVQRDSVRRPIHLTEVNKRCATAPARLPQ